jgi:uncharacterized membrane protein YedE/YeeE|tara:strand:+ start:509 stop:934 length:426 start_codon:yes stop_codon:yes gene_type:complete
MYNFTPISALTGGLIIGCAVVLFFYTTGRLAGISGIFANAFTSKENRSSNLLFLLGLVIGPLGYLYFTKIPVNFEITNSYILVIIAGFLVGLGTRMGGGCTSGHGICGISRFSFRSIIATITFIISGVITVLILQQFGFYL